MPMLRSIDVFNASSSESFIARGSFTSLSVSATTGGAVVGPVGVTGGGTGCTGTIFGGGACAASDIAPNKQITAVNRRTAVIKNLLDTPLVRNEALRVSGVNPLARAFYRRPRIFPRSSLKYPSH